jgi:hypothetical protein
MGLEQKAIRLMFEVTVCKAATWNRCNAKTARHYGTQAQASRLFWSYVVTYIANNMIGVT